MLLLHSLNKLSPTQESHKQEKLKVHGNMTHSLRTKDSVTQGMHSCSTLPTYVMLACNTLISKHFNSLTG
jgi:hypothetical protein